MIAGMGFMEKIKERRITMDELIICVAPYPGEKQEEKFPSKMDVAQEVIDSYNAGASIAHLHVRDVRRFTNDRYRSFSEGYRKNAC